MSKSDPTIEACMSGLTSGLAKAPKISDDQVRLLMEQLINMQLMIMGRMSKPGTQQTQQPSDQWLTVDQAAEKMSISKDTLYHNWKQYSFANKVGGSLRFSSNGIDKHMSNKAA